jgi:hypothetical protein
LRGGARRPGKAAAHDPKPTRAQDKHDNRAREMVEEILEGGKAAFEMRRQKYGF